MLEVVKKTAENCFIPLTVGGGVRNLDDISRLLHFGADKVSINTAAVNNIDLVAEAANKYGSSTIVIAVTQSKLLKINGEYSLMVGEKRPTLMLLLTAMKWQN